MNRTPIQSPRSLKTPRAPLKKKEIKWYKLPELIVRVIDTINGDGYSCDYAPLKEGRYGFAKFDLFEVPEQYQPYFKKKTHVDTGCKYIECKVHEFFRAFTKYATDRQFKYVSSHCTEHHQYFTEEYTDAVTKHKKWYPEEPPLFCLDLSMFLKKRIQKQTRKRKIELIDLTGAP